MLASGIQGSLLVCPRLKLIIRHCLLPLHVGKNERNHHFPVASVVPVEVDDGKVAHVLYNEASLSKPRGEGPRQFAVGAVGCETGGRRSYAIRWDTINK